MLQEASGAAGHPSYRRYHYGSGPLLVEDGSNRRFISTDALGSTTDLTTTDAGGSVSSMRKYDAWGQYRNGTAPLATEPKLGFTGHQYDPETGLVYARARYYDPDLGRFLSRDSYEGSLSEAPSLHRYAYAWMNPLRYWDGTGYCTEGEDAGCENAGWDKVVAVWDSLTSSETQDESLARQREERHQKTVASGETTVKEDPNAPSTTPAQPQDPDDANVAEVMRDRQYVARAQGEAADKARPIVQTAVELAAPTATAAATLKTGKNFWGGEATPEEMKEAKETLVGSVAAPAMVGAVAKYGGKLLAWGKKKGGALLGKVFGRGEKVAEEVRDAASALNGAKLKEYLRQAEEYGAGGVKELENGKFRFYGEVVPASKPGEMAGRRVVREWDSGTGAKRTWHETVDQQGNIRQVRPDTSVTGGQKVHYVFDENGEYKGKW